MNVVVCCSVTKLWPTLCNPMDCSTPGFPVLRHLLEFAQTHVHWVSDAISSSDACFSSCPQPFPASGSFKISPLFTSGGQSIGASASAFSHLNEYSGLISFRKSDWFDLFAVRGTLKSLLYHHSLKASSSALNLFYCPALTFIHD